MLPAVTHDPSSSPTVAGLLALTTTAGVSTAANPTTRGGLHHGQRSRPTDGDGTGHCQNGNPDVNCNIYDGKEFVWLNRGAQCGLRRRPQLLLGGSRSRRAVRPQRRSREEPERRLRRRREADVHGDGRDHDQLRGNLCLRYNKIRLAPYADTTNPGGVYILRSASSRVQLRSPVQVHVRRVQGVGGGHPDPARAAADREQGRERRLPPPPTSGRSPRTSTGRSPSRLAATPPSTTR